MDIAEQAQREGVRDLRQSGLIKVRSGVDDTRRSDLGHERVANEIKQRRGSSVLEGTMATAAVAAKKRIKDFVFEWEGKDKNGKNVRGEMRAGGEAMVSASLRRQGVLVTKVKKRRMSGGKAIKQKDIAIFTRQLVDDDARRRAADPVVRHRRPRQHQPEDDAAAHRHPHRRRDRHQPVGGVPQAPAATSTPCTATWSRPAKPAVSWKRCSIAWPSTRKRRWRSRTRSSRP